MKKDRSKVKKVNDPDTHEGNAGDDGIMELFNDTGMKVNSTRRNFLKLVGYSFASAAVMAACKRPVQLAIPYAVQPPEITPGTALFYASTFFDGHEYCSILVKTRDGRPIKIEGNALSMFNGEGTTARVQASVLSLYDDARLKYPQIDNKKVSWDVADREIMNDLSAVNADQGEIALLTSTIISPTTVKLIEKFGSGFRNFRWVQYDPVSYSAILEANRESFGKSVIPDYNFQNARFVLSVNADFLGTWVAPVHFIPKYISQRKLNEGKKEMLRHIHYETGFTLTGANADERRKIRPSEEKAFFIALYNLIAKEKGKEPIPGPAFREDLSKLAVRLGSASGKSIVVSGSADKEVQIVVNAINSMLENYATCIDLDNNIRSAAGTDSEMENLVADMNAGRIRALLMYNVNPLYDYHDPEKFTEGLKKTKISIDMSPAQNETVGAAKYECPVSHFLESWNDYEITPGQLSISQPCINRIFDTRSFQESLLKWSGENVTWHDYLASAWEKDYFPLSGEKIFTSFWNKSVGNGVFSTPNKEKGSYRFDDKALAVISAKQADSTEGYEVILYPSVALGTGMHANNPWLMELPDPLTRQCWENVALFSTADAAKLGIVTGMVVKLGENISIPALIQQGTD
jgi:molybdopterin-containing oxidoreductase family iron-sulfur binding subunit